MQPGLCYKIPEVITVKESKIYPIRYYAVGHSYLVHGPFVGWQTKGFWGMAASKPEADYFHRVQQRLQEKLPCSMNAMAENYATYERLCTATATEETYKNSAEYARMRSQLQDFKPNLITLYIGGGNTIANDPESLSLFYHTLYSMVAENKQPEAVVICPFSNQKTLFAMEIAREYGFVPVELMVLHEQGKTRDNPYYAIGQYPQYDAAVAAGAIEFRTHPGDFGHDAIAERIVETAVPLLSAQVGKIDLPADQTLTATATAETVGETPVGMGEDRGVLDHWDFDDLRDVFEMGMGGFNLRCADSIVQLSSAPGTGAAVYHEALQLSAEKYSRFAVQMKLECQEPEKGILLQVTTDTKTYECIAQLPPQTMGRLTLPLPEGTGTITGFRIAPQMTDCCIYIDRIAFET